MEIHLFLQINQILLNWQLTQLRTWIALGLWVNFTCVTSESNPPVYNFLLYEKDGNISHSKSGTWITKISRGGRHVKLYSCVALHAVENVTSSNNVTLTVNGEFCQCKNSFNQFQTFMCT